MMAKSEIFDNMMSAVASELPFKFDTTGEK
jgi:hypothetical protein